MKKRYLVLEDGTVIEGKAFGAEKTGSGELVFTTGMGGYIETLTDPAYYGQIVLQTYPLIGNYGIIEEDLLGPCYLSGYVVREYCKVPSNFRCDKTLDTYLQEQGVPGIYGIDTRALTKHIRNKGTMKAKLMDSYPERNETFDGFRGEEAVDEVCVREKTEKTLKNGRVRLAVIDYGCRTDIIDGFKNAGCSVTVYPAWTEAEEILKDNHDGIYLSSGPGNPSEMEHAVEQVKKLMGRKPVFGTGLGHQLMALANGGKLRKLLYGHRGSNEPSKFIFGDRTFMTEQNHGYTVLPGTVEGAEVIFENLNDGTCEGLIYRDLNAMSVEFYPDMEPGLSGTWFVVENFIDTMGGTEYAAE